MFFIQHWTSSVALKLAEHKSEAVLVTSREKVKSITLSVREHDITSQPFIRYLGVMIDTELNFKPHMVYTSRKAAAVGIILSRLMPNIGGPKQKRSALL